MRGKRREQAFESPDDQLALWVKGEAIHNTTRDECCPDFSCCSQIDTPREERERFQVADEKTRMGMLMTYLGRMVAVETQDKKVHIAGREP